MGTPRAARLLRAVDHYRAHFRRWDTLYVLSKVKISSAGEGRMTGSFEVTEDVLNCAGTLHGGFASSVADVFASFGFMQHPRGAVAWTTDMSIVFLNAGKKGDIVRVEVLPVSVTRSRSVMECLLTDQRGRCIAKATVGVISPATARLVEALPYDPAAEPEDRPG